MREKGNGWIYRNPFPEHEELFKRIEAALGFNLFVWQKSFIVMGHFRQYGETTARILRELLDTEAVPLDYTRRCMSHREDFYRQELRKIQERLKDAGIKTRVVFWSAGKERAGMTNILLIIVILLLVDIYGQLKKLNERQGKEDAGNND